MLWPAIGRCSSFALGGAPASVKWAVAREPLDGIFLEGVHRTPRRSFPSEGQREQRRWQGGDVAGGRRRADAVLAPGAGARAAEAKRSSSPHQGSKKALVELGDTPRAENRARPTRRTRPHDSRRVREDHLTIYNGPVDGFRCFLQRRAPDFRQSAYRDIRSARCFRCVADYRHTIETQIQERFFRESTDHPSTHRTEGQETKGGGDM